MDIKKFKELPVIGILRGVAADIIEPLTETIVSSGLKTVEITMNTPGAAELIKRLKSASGTHLTIGAGTVLTTGDLEKAVDAGATFIVMPTLVRDVVERCVKNRIPVFPGALTPQEIYNAWHAGATMVKVFPAKCFGPSYFKEIKGPFGDVELLACGGVTPENIKSFFSCGASGVTFGGSVFKKEALVSRDFAAIEKAIKAFIAGLNRR
ncbi:MAG: bifunctional 4-hydroxy-2-oxoglutarate aldolase/2-dehydro-3-deoxy-phosphogluconate aldolase [Omnitrophica bacterium]|nr:bifunctional 4-hydroxy-2-oxoglutarate aldolase/2-dehydro-3-deoxy-phosphogluconate aldolase [Candidatus Omnitrophota bacterium]